MFDFIRNCQHFAKLVMIFNMFIKNTCEFQLFHIISNIWCRLSFWIIHSSECGHRGCGKWYLSITESLSSLLGAIPDLLWIYSRSHYGLNFYFMCLLAIPVSSLVNVSSSQDIVLLFYSRNIVILTFRAITHLKQILCVWCKIMIEIYMLTYCSSTIKKNNKFIFLLWILLSHLLIISWSCGSIFVGTGSRRGKWGGRREGGKEKGKGRRKKQKKNSNSFKKKNKMNKNKKKEEEENENEKKQTFWTMLSRFLLRLQLYTCQFA